MPIYEYECESCGVRTEAIQRLAEEPLKECRECGGALRRLISAPAVQFKGTGWYVTDYGGRKGAKDGSSAGESSSSGTKEASDTKGSSEKSEGKPDASGSTKAASTSPSE